jgi:hypothetical protein
MSPWTGPAPVPVLHAFQQEGADVIRRDVIMIGLSPTFLRVAATSGGKVSEHGVVVHPLEPGDWDQIWNQRLTQLDTPLQDAIKTLGVGKGAPARVVYIGPKASAEVFNIPAEGATALKAAEMSLRESLTDKNASCPLAVHTLHRDSANDEGDQARSHILGVSDSAPGSNIVGAWVRRSGLEIEGLIPAKAAALALAVKTATTQPESGSHAVLWVGEHVTALAGWHRGRLVFARAIDFGFWLLGDAIYRAARAQGNANFGRQDAYRLLFGSGVPRRGQVVDADLRLSAEHVLPFMQPVIQRYVVETRQTLRFGIPESELPRTSLILSGPGSSVPALASLLEPQIDVVINRNAAADQPGFMQNAGYSELLGLETSGFSLMPPAEADRRINRRLNASLRVGAMAAVMGLVAMAGWNYSQTSKASRQLRQLEDRTDAMNQHAIMRERAERMANDIGSASKVIRETLGNRPRWMAALAMVSKACGETVELNHIAGGFPAENGGVPVLTLSGTAWPSGQASKGGDSLGAFLDRLTGSPLVTSAKIVSTHADVNGGEAKTFVISVQLKAAGPERVMAAVMKPEPGQPTAQAQESNP